MQEIHKVGFIYLRLKQAWFIRAVLGSLHNWAGSTESSHILPAP